MSIQTAETVGEYHQYPEVYHQFFEAGARLGYEPDEVYEAMGPINGKDAVAIININGVTVVSSRFVTNPVLDIQNPWDDFMPPKGGIMGGPGAGPDAIRDKAVLMGAKNILFPVASTNTKFYAGGKGGLLIPEDTEMDEETYKAILAEHAKIHGYGPDRPGGVGAPDERTGPFEMGVMIGALEKDKYPLARASFTGAPAEYGGIPHFRLPATGKGGAIVLARYFEAEATKDPLLKKTIEEARIVGGAIVEGWGGAGRPFGEHLRQQAPYMRVSSVIERYWALCAKENTGFVNPADVNKLIKEGYLNGEGSRLPRGSDYKLVDKEEAWARRALVAVPAARAHTINAARVASWNGVEVELDIANNPVTPDGVEKLRQRKIAHILGSLANAGGVHASSHEGVKAIYELGGPNVGWDPEGYQNTWYQNLSSTATRIFKQAQGARRDGEVLPIDEVINDIVVDRLVKNFRELKRTGRAPAKS